MDHVLKISVFIERIRLLLVILEFESRQAMTDISVSLHGVVHSYMTHCTLKVYNMDGVPYRCMPFHTCTSSFARFDAGASALILWEER